MAMTLGRVIRKMRIPRKDRDPFIVAVVLLVLAVLALVFFGRSPSHPPTPAASATAPVAKTVPLSAIIWRTYTVGDLTVKMPETKYPTVVLSNPCSQEAPGCEYDSASGTQVLNELYPTNTLEGYCLLTTKQVNAQPPDFWSNCSVASDVYQIEVITIPQSDRNDALRLAEAWNRCAGTTPDRVGDRAHSTAMTQCDAVSADSNFRFDMVVRDHNSKLYEVYADGALSQQFFNSVRFTATR